MLSSQIGNHMISLGNHEVVYYYVFMKSLVVVYGNKISASLTLYSWVGQISPLKFIFWHPCCFHIPSSTGYGSI